MWVDKFHTNLYTDFKWSTDLRGYLQEICFLTWGKFMPQRFVPHHWLSCYDVSISI